VKLTTHLHPSAKVHTPQHVFMAWCLIKQWICLKGAVLSKAQGIYLHLYRNSLVSIVTRLWSGRPGFDSRQEQEFFLFATAFRQTSLLFNEEREIFTWVKGVRGVKLTTHLHLVQRLRMRGAIPPLPHTSWRGA
jgi:hypothetical protein